MASDLPWRMWFEAQYRTKTKWFKSAAQHGIYKNLLHEQLDNGDMFDDDVELRAIACATPEEWAVHWPKIRERFFIAKDGKIWNPRAKQVRDDQARGDKSVSKRMSKAATARWDAERARKEAAGEDVPKDKPVSREAVELYNELAARIDIPIAQLISKDRLAKVAQRLMECHGIEGWKAALAKLEGSSFCRGGGPRGWKIDLDALVQRKTFRKLMEGSFDDPKTNGRSTRPTAPNTTVEARRAAIIDALEATGMEFGPGSTEGHETE